MNAPRQSGSISFAPLILIACILTGCTCTPLGDGDAKRDRWLKTFPEPDAERAGLYIYRNESTAGAIWIEIEIDGQEIGRTARKTYLYKDVPPGRHRITSNAENSDSIEIDFQPGTLNYVWQEVSTGNLYARSRLHQMSEADGQEGVRETVLVKGR